MTSPARVDRLLLVLALAYLFLVTAGDEVVRRGERDVIEPGAGYLLSRFRLVAGTCIERCGGATRCALS